MNKREFIEFLKNEGINLSNYQIELFKKYLEFLLEYNKNTNLTAIRDEEGVYLKHFYDSVILAKYIALDNKKLLDIGSGAGFPGVPLKIVFPNLDLTLMDSNGKKTQFLKKLKLHLCIDYDVINDRAENYIINNREKYDIVTARAVTSMPVLSELCLPFVKLEGKFIAYKGKIDDTIEDGKYAIGELGGEIENIHKFSLPIVNDDRAIIFINKICKTPANYPRTYEKIKKKPLKK